MFVKELIRDHDFVITIGQNHRLSDAADLMNREHVGAIVVVQDDRVVGIITDRDIALSICLGAATAASYVTEVMTRKVETIDINATISEAIQHLRNSRVRRLPVLENDRLVGMISADQLMASLANQIAQTNQCLDPGFQVTV